MQAGHVFDSNILPMKTSPDNLSIFNYISLSLLRHLIPGNFSKKD